MYVLHFFGYRSLTVLKKLFKLIRINPLNIEFRFSAQFNSHYFTVQFANQNECEIVFNYFGRQTVFNAQKMRNSFLIKENEPDLNVIAQSLIVLRPNNNFAEQNHLDLHQTAQMINMWNVKDDYCFQIKTCLIDIVKILVIEGKHDDISQMLEKRIKNIIDHSHSVTIKYQHQPAVKELKRILMFLNQFINALNNKENNVIEVRMFCFGNTNLPLPVYQLRNRFLNKGSSFLVIQSSTESGKTMLIPIFMIKQLRNNKNIRIIITQPTSITVKQIAKTIKEKIIGNEFSVGTDIQQQYDICVCTPMQVLKMIQHQNQDMQQYIYSNTIFILDEFHTRMYYLHNQNKISSILIYLTNLL
ncbi:Nonsense-mediated_mRNA decay protein [Hexamita inflata]|uniref:Nonsense-mediated mRNA decay protein n=1 Tax=Hexamita inflata TaxID=28002 RepID=A0AA86QAN2_9EUKA|nr:Nonsense-mediated mRNA decay protein [Hexamita inflata]